MLNKTVNGWNIEETENGISFEHRSTWKQIQACRTPEILRDYMIKGIYENNGALIIPIVKNGVCKLMKIEAENGCQYISIIEDVPTGAFRRILKLFCEIEETGSGRIIEK